MTSNLSKATANLKLLILAIAVSSSLAACSSSEGDDLDEFMDNAGKDIRSKSDALPEVKAYIPLEYNADGVLPDPFKARKVKSNSGGVFQPNLNRPKEPLEMFPIESLKFVGTIEKGKLRYALLNTPDSTVQQVKIGNYIGQNFGMVTDVTENSISVKEIVQDELTGDWAERLVSIELQE